MFRDVMSLNSKSTRLTSNVSGVKCFAAAAATIRATLEPPTRRILSSFLLIRFSNQNLTCIQNYFFKFLSKSQYQQKSRLTYCGPISIQEANRIY